MSDIEISQNITFDDAISDIANDPIKSANLKAAFDEFITNTSIHNDKEFAKLQGLKEHFRHKKYWSWFLMGAMGFMIFFQSFLLIMVGMQKWSFIGYDWLLPTLMIQYLVQIVGLAVFVVKSLFNEMN